MSALSFDAVGHFCSTHRDACGGYRACSTCPIQPACHSECTPLTQVALDAWKARCVEALAATQGAPLAALEKQP
ncbi:hypothetical protein [Pseudoxanthomonas winnipegensis]|uniref:hypothetical protein n=1 Tax=Pseudoxanthomonas winnipegensis TaxID=2480810 RepID=UPI00102D8CCF|nr:hypothetical protein [Pseudoxanthomonas winnipegensis]RZZ85658.1 hypothetical protein EA663_11645 [Pseudoxanthomonas winnipegensis]